MKFDINRIDRRVIYLLVLLALSLPLIYQYSVPPARMAAAEALFKKVEELQVKSPDLVFVALDYGPNLVAENGAQAEVVVEHLMRRRIPVALFSIYYQAEPILEALPQRVAARLMKESPSERWEYGKDWVNLGYRPGGYIFIRPIAESKNLVEYLNKDARGTKLTEVPMMKGVERFENIKMLIEITGLINTFDLYVAFFQKKDYRPAFGHGCTSITIPEAFIYLDSKQIDGLLEGVAGAAWYSKLLQDKFTAREPDKSFVINTGLGIAHLVVIGLIILGNVTSLLARRKTA